MMTNWCVAVVTDVYQQRNAGKQERCWAASRWTEVSLSKAVQPQMHIAPIQINVRPLTPPLMIACFCVWLWINQCKKKHISSLGLLKETFFFILCELNPNQSVNWEKKEEEGMTNISMVALYDWINKAVEITWYYSTFWKVQQVHYETFSVCGWKEYSYIHSWLPLRQCGKKKNLRISTFCFTRSETIILKQDESIISNWCWNTG